MVTLAQLEVDFRWLIITTLALGVCTDTFVAGLLCYYVTPKPSSSKGM